jgi:hypothetical protein
MEQLTSARPMSSQGASGVDAWLIRIGQRGGRRGYFELAGALVAQVAAASAAERVTAAIAEARLLVSLKGGVIVAKSERAEQLSWNRARGEGPSPTEGGEGAHACGSPRVRASDAPPHFT